MSTPIWDEGSVAACVCVMFCDRCNKRGPCVQMMVVAPHRHVNLCFACWSDLVLRVAEYAVSRFEVRG